MHLSLFLCVFIGCAQCLDPLISSQLSMLNLTQREPVVYSMQSGGERSLHGRFLHITDMHPDPLYKTGGEVSSACHNGKQGEASEYGDAMLGCDAPMKLVKETLLWVRENLKDHIDFVIWTGDNVRHDNDRSHPRLEQDIFEMNEEIAQMMTETFQDDDEMDVDPWDRRVRLIPSIGNNDVFPHNLFAPGPTLQTREFWRIWRHYVPPEQLHVFTRGAYFFVEVIPNKLAVLSINTLYLYQANPLVDNCDKRSQPGYRLFEWLGVVLQEMRQRKMKVWLSGHVPPNAKNYDGSCLRKFTAWTHEYRDVIIGSLFGHMNIDHFIPLDSDTVYPSETDADVHGSELRLKGGAPSRKVQYMEDVVRKMYYKLETDNFERYSIAHVGPSVVPTFNPGLRVWEYNVTGLSEEGDSGGFEEASKKKDKSMPRKMPKGTPLGPAYIEQLFSPQRYVQYFANLSAINAGKPFQYELQYATDDESYQMSSLLVKDWIGLGQRLGDKGKKKSKKEKGVLRKLWRTYLNRAFVATGYEEMDM